MEGETGKWCVLYQVPAQLVVKLAIKALEDDAQHVVMELARGGASYLRTDCATPGGPVLEEDTTSGAEAKVLCKQTAGE